MFLQRPNKINKHAAIFRPDRAASDSNHSLRCLAVLSDHYRLCQGGSISSTDLSGDFFFEI